MRNKKPGRSKNPTPVKSPFGSVPPPVKSIPRQDRQRDECPSWHFSILDWEGDWGWSKLSNTDFCTILRWMKDVECLSWKEIQIQTVSRAKHHKMPIGELCRDAQKRLEELCQDDIDEVFSFRLDGKKRLWGIVERGIFKILWWDPEHTIYPVSKSHT
jgi:hypothetical protein